MLTFSQLARLDRKVKELAQEKEELLKTSKSQSTTIENVKVQVDTLLKVANVPFPYPNPSYPVVRPDCIGNRQEGRGAHSSFHELTPRHVSFELTFRSLVSLFHTFCSLLYRPPWGSTNQRTQTMMNLIDATYNLDERTEITVRPGKDILCVKFGPGCGCGEKRDITIYGDEGLN